MSWNEGKTYMYLYRGCEDDFLDVLRDPCRRLEDIRDVEVSEKLHYAVTQLPKTPGRVVWQLRIPLELFVRATTVGYIQRHWHNREINWIIRRDWIPGQLDRPEGILIRKLQDALMRGGQDPSEYEV